MTYNTGLAQRMRNHLNQIPYLTEKAMFGGVAFMVNGNMACGVHKQSMIVRVGSEKHDLAMALPHTHIFDLTGRPMAGWVLIDPEGCEGDEQLQAWIQKGLDFARSLPAK